MKHNPNENTELGLQASAFKSKEEEGYDIAGEYWLSENGAENPDDDASAAMSVGRYHEHAQKPFELHRHECRALWDGPPFKQYVEMGSHGTNGENQ